MILSVNSFWESDVLLWWDPHLFEEREPNGFKFWGRIAGLDEAEGALGLLGC
jgi:hypothetical protein